MTYQERARRQAERWKEYAAAARWSAMWKDFFAAALRHAASQSTAPELKRQVIAEMGGPMRPRNARTTEKHQAATLAWWGPLPARRTT